MISIIAAVAKNYCIGKNNELPWDIPNDLKHFREITEGKIVLMGRKTFEYIFDHLHSPLPNRKNVVITGDTNYRIPMGVEVYNNINTALTKYKDHNILVIGGGEMYKQTINLANKLYITWVDMEVNGDTFFPKIEEDDWEEKTRENHEGFSFVEYIKK